VVELIAGLILGRACVGLGVFQLVSPRRMARINVRYNRWWHARIPWFYSLPDEQQPIGPGRPRLPAIGLVIAVRAVIAAISAK
jgi:hypothetical protein